MTSRVDVILLVVGTLHMTSRFSLLAPYPTERLDVILHQNYINLVNVHFVCSYCVTTLYCTNPQITSEERSTKFLFNN
jgi:hypothetical protein